MTRKSTIWLAAMVVLGSVPTANARDLGDKAEPEVSAPIKLVVAAQPIAAALNEFARQSGLHVVIGSEVAAGVKSKPLEGMFTREAALERLLSDTGLRYEYLDAQTVAVLGKEEGRRTSVDGLEETSLMVAQSDSTAASNQDEGAKAGPRPSQGGAGAGIEEIVVTAQKREQRLQDVPISITAITAEDIDRRGLVNSEDYLRGMAGVNQLGGDGIFGGQAIIIRGLETASAAQNFGAGATTATYFGEAPTTTSAGIYGSNIDIKLVDIARVEVLRGPQGTAFGSSAMGGAVRTIPAPPLLDRFEGNVGAGYSGTARNGGNNHDLRAVANIPLIADRLALRGVAYKFSDSGYYRNRAGSDTAFQTSFVIPNGLHPFAVDEDEVGDYNVTGGRISAFYRANDDLKLTFTYLKQKSDSDGFQLANIGKYDQAVIQVAPEHARSGQTGGGSDFSLDLANAVIEYDLHWADLLATYSYVKGDADIMQPYGPMGVISVPIAASAGRVTSNRTDSGEIRLVTKFNGRWNFLAGLYAEKVDDEFLLDVFWNGDPDLSFAGPGNRLLYLTAENRHQKQQAAFGEASWEFMPRWTLTGGVRVYEYDRTYRLDQSGFFAGTSLGAPVTSRSDQDASGELFRGNLSHKLSDNALVYGGWSQGFRLGKSQGAPPAGLCDVNGDGLIDGTDVPLDSFAKVESDTVDSYEIGGKFSLLNRRLAVDAAAYRMNWTDIPGTQFVACAATVLPRNVGTARVNGIELQTNFQIDSNWKVSFGGSWLDTELTKEVTNTTLVGARLPGSPEFNANFGVQYAFMISGHEASVQADSIYIGPYNEFEDYESGDYMTVNTSARVTLGKVDVSLFVRNLTNEDAFTARGAEIGPLYGYRLRPRTVGVRLGYAFD